MGLEALSTEDKAKLKHVVQTGIQTMQEMKDLREGMSDLVNNVCKELDINKKDLSNAIKIGFKKNQRQSALDEEKEGLDNVEHILSISGV